MTPDSSDQTEKNDSYYTTPGTAIWDGHNGYRYIQYRAYFTGGSTPVLHDVTITYNEASPVPPVPELPSLILFATGLLILTGYVLLRKKNK
jgi:hypothetical protein